MALEACVKPASATGNRAVLYEERPGDESDALYTTVGGGAAQGQVTNAGLVDATVNGTGIPANVWTHLALTHDGSTLRIYVNGTAAGSVAAAPMLSTNNPLYLGGNVYQGD